MDSLSSRFLLQPSLVHSAGAATISPPSSPSLLSFPAHYPSLPATAFAEYFPSYLAYSPAAAAGPKILGLNHLERFRKSDSLLP